MTGGESQHGNGVPTLRQSADMFRGVAQALAFPIVVWTTRFGTWGTRYASGWAFLGFFLWPLTLATVYNRDRTVGLLGLFWFASLALLVAHAVAGGRLRRRGHRCHSLYWGTSRFDPGTGYAATRRARERDALVAIAFGLVSLAVGCRPLGALLLIGAVAKFLDDQAAFRAADDRLRQMDDLRYENDFYLDQHRRRWGTR